MTDFPPMFRALRHRNYRLFFCGQIISLVGTWMQSVAQSWLVYRLTGSSLLLGLVGFASQFPVFLLSPLGGVAADRGSRHRIVIATQTASMLLALALAALTLLGSIHVWHVMVEPGDLLNAIALNSSMVNGARVLGPAIAGILVAVIGEGWCFFANGISYIAVLTGLLLMRVPRHEGAAMTGGFEAVVEGFRFVLQTGPIRALLLLLGIVSLSGMPYVVLMPIFADQVLHGGPRALGTLMGASGIGALAGTLTLAAKQQIRGLGRWVTFACVGFGVSMMLFSLSRWQWLSVVLLAPVGFSMMLQMSASNTLIQAMVPDRLRGRVMAVYTMMFMGMAPFGALLAGSLASRLGAPLTVALGGLLSCLGGLAFGHFWPGLRSEARRLVFAQGLHAGEPPDQLTEQAVSSSD
jgi:MFS family permease